LKVEKTVSCSFSDGDISLTTHLENVEMPGNFTDVRDMSGMLVKLGEMSGNCQ